MTTDVARDLAAVAERLGASTVRVIARDGSGVGSGVVVAAGLVVTNAHVVRAREADVRFADGRIGRARTVARDERVDLALLRAGVAAGAPADLRRSRTLVPGELVVALGNPHGIANALATGIVERRNARWVMSDVRLAPGNSGGPLADAAGRVVGINAMIAGGRSFAVPTEAIERFYEVVRRAA